MCRITTSDSVQQEKDNSVSPVILGKRKLRKKNKSLKRTKLGEKKISLIQAARSGNINVLKEILSNFDNVVDNNINEKVVGCTALHYATFYNHLEAVKLLVEHEADIDVQNTSGITPINWAVEKGNIEIVSYLLDKCDPSIPDNFGLTPLHKAVISGNLDMVKLLLSCNTESEIWVDINAITTEEFYTPLHFAIIKGHHEIAKFLLENKASINIRSKSGAQPIHYSVTKESNIEVVKLLISQESFNINTLDNNLRTPLHWALLYGNINIAELLISNGSDCKLRDINQLTPFDISTSPEVRSRLENAVIMLSFN